MESPLHENKPHVCHIISGDLWAGAEVMIFNLLSSLIYAQKIKVCAIVLNEGRLSEELKRAGVTVFTIEEKKHSFISIVTEVGKIIKEQKINVVHSHRYKENFIAFFVKIFFKRIALVSTLHGLPEIIGAKNGIKYKLICILNFKLLKNSFSMLVPVSYESATYLSNVERIHLQKIRPIHNGILIDNGIIKSKNEKSTFVIGTAGRLFPIKNYEFLLELAYLLKEYDILFKIAGDGPDREKLAKKCGELNLNDKVQFCGNIANMSNFYSTLDVYINTSLHEGVPMTILEAMSYYLPVIAPKVGGIPEIINHGKNGFLITSGDKEKFSEYCILLFRNKELCRAMGLDARKSVKDSFSIEACTKKYTEVYQECL